MGEQLPDPGVLISFTSYWELDDSVPVESLTSSYAKSNITDFI
jgi:hypothetical protein